MMAVEKGGDNHFNLIEEDWIPVVGPSGFHQIGIRKLLTNAHTLSAIDHKSPLVVSSLYRLLLAILHRAFMGPKDIDHWGELWDEGQFEQGVIEQYLKKWSHRFNLFDDERPFFQVPNSEQEGVNEWLSVKLCFEKAGGNNATLFDHSRDDETVSLTPAEGACRLVAFQNYSLGGRAGSVTSTQAASLVRHATFIIRGENLFETLMLNLVQYNERAEKPFRWARQQEMPAWEADELPKNTERLPRGWTDWLTFQTRRVTLLRSDNGTIGRMKTDAGFKRPDDVDTRLYEKMTPFVQGKKKWNPVNTRKEQALWRNVTSLLYSTTGITHPAGNFDWYYDLILAGKLESTPLTPIIVCSLENDKSKVEHWSQQEVPIPISRMRDEKLVIEIEKALQTVNDCEWSFRGAVRKFAEKLIAKSQPSKNDVHSLYKSLSAENRFWGPLEAEFYKVVENLCNISRDFGDTQEKWKEYLRKHTITTVNEITDGHQPSARAFEAAAMAQRKLFYELKAKGVGHVE